MPFSKLCTLILVVSTSNVRKSPGKHIKFCYNVTMSSHCVNLPGGNLKTDSTFNPSTLNSSGSESRLLGTLVTAISIFGKLQSPGSYLVWILMAFFKICTGTSIGF